MSEMLKRLITEQNTVWQRMQDIRKAAEGEKRDFTAEERENWDKAEERLTEVSGDIERLNRDAKLKKVDRSTILSTSGDDDEEDRETGTDAEAAKRYSDAFDGYLRHGLSELPAEQRQILATGRQTVRDQGTNEGTKGGYLVPDAFRNKLTETMKAYGGLLSMVEVINTDTGANLPWPTNDDTNNEGEILGENRQVTEQDIEVGERELGAFIFSSKMVKVSLNLLQDNGFGLAGWLPGKLGERIGRRAARAWTTGSGVKEPQGLMTGAVVGKQGASGQTTSIIYDDTIDLEHSVDPAYRRNAKYLLGDTMLATIRKLKDGDSRPLWVPIPAPGFPATINGFAYEVDNSMPTPAASAKTIAFGDFRAAYIVRMVLAMQTMRLTERYADYLQVAFLGFSRMDGMVQDPAAVRTYQQAAS